MTSQLLMASQTDKTDSLRHHQLGDLPEYRLGTRGVVAQRLRQIVQSGKQLRELSAPQRQQVHTWLRATRIGFNVGKAVHDATILE